eukprot:jgi/Bigna1/76177/fgenesh1_pg.39_\
MGTTAACAWRVEKDFAMLQCVEMKEVWSMGWVLHVEELLRQVGFLEAIVGSISTYASPSWSYGNDWAFRTTMDSMKCKSERCGESEKLRTSNRYGIGCFVVKRKRSWTGRKRTQNTIAITRTHRRRMRQQDRNVHDTIGAQTDPVNDENHVNSLDMKRRDLLTTNCDYRQELCHDDSEVNRQSKKEEESEELSIFCTHKLEEGYVWEIEVEVDANGDPSYDSSDSDSEMWTHIGFVPSLTCSPSAIPVAGVVGWIPGSVSWFQSGCFYSNRQKVFSTMESDLDNVGKVSFTRGDKLLARLDLREASTSVVTFANLIHPEYGFVVANLTRNDRGPMWFGATFQAVGQKAAILSISRR